MDHRITDAINKAFDDEVSRLFAELCQPSATDDEARAKIIVFGSRMDVAWTARAAALEEMRQDRTLQPVSAD